MAVQQMVAIAARSMSCAEVLILDELEVEPRRTRVTFLFGILRRLRDDGMAILFVTHFLDQVVFRERAYHRFAKRKIRRRISGERIAAIEIDRRNAWPRFENFNITRGKSARFHANVLLPASSLGSAG